MSRKLIFIFDVVRSKNQLTHLVSKPLREYQRVTFNLIKFFTRTIRDIRESNFKRLVCVYRLTGSFKS